MARRGSARVDIDESIPPEVLALLDKNESIIADMMLSEAKATTLFKDDTGKLRKSGRKIKVGDGYIVQFGGPGAKQAFLVEYGHEGINPAPAKPFLRNAKSKVISKIK